MPHYECCYTSGRQFVFVEQRRWVMAGLVAIALCGLVVGLSIGVTISLAGILVFEVLMAAFACCVAYQAYLFMFRRVASSADIATYIIGNLIFLVSFCILLVSIRACVELDIGAMNRSALLSVGGVVIGIVFWGYVRLVLREDERKHHLGPCSPDGRHAEHAIDVPGHAAEVLSEGGTWDDVVTFAVWILSWRWWRDLYDYPMKSDEECSAADSITVHNHTLKLIKVCFYSPDDMFCWVPFGGISGRCVAFIRAEDCRTFNLGRRKGSGRGRGPFQLKVFQPGVFDKELACLPRARCGGTFTFSDVEGMVRRSMALSSPLCQAAVRRDSSFTVSESSEDELSPAFRGQLGGRCGSGPLSRCGSGGQLARGGAETLKRTNRMDSMSTMALSSGPNSPVGSSASSDGANDCDLLEVVGGSSGSFPICPEMPRSRLESRHFEGRSSETRPSADARPRLEARRAGPEEIVVRNKSNMEIRARLFRTHDFCYLVPLVGNLTACGDTIVPHGEMRFDPKNTEDGEFTLKVYSVGPGAKELTYLTASRGHAYTFCDSLLS